MKTDHSNVWICAAMLVCPAFWTVQARADENSNGNSQGYEQVGTIPVGAVGKLQRGVSTSNSGTNAKPTQIKNVIDHGGPIINTSTIYFIWWGTGFPSDAKAGLESIAQGMENKNGTPTGYLNIMQQYMRQTSTQPAISSVYGGTADDLSVPPTHGPSTATIVNEACSVIKANGWTPDPNALYTVVTSNFPKINYCAWHSHGNCSGVDIKVAYIPNATGIAGCDPGNLFNCNLYSQGTRSMADSYAHEFAETISDPDSNAWYDSSGNEIADKCNFTYSACVNLMTGPWQLQEIWSNANSACAQQSPPQ
jgi:hypothetical protein